MPKTKFQSIVFTATMVFCMVFCMTVYTIAMKFGGLSYTVFGLAIREMWMEYVIVFHNGFTADWFPLRIQLAFLCFPVALCLQVFFVGPLVRLVFRTVSKKHLA